MPPPRVSPCLHPGEGVGARGGGTAWGGSPCIQPPPILLWVGGLGSEASRVGWMCSSWLHFRGSCGVQGGRRGPGGSALCPPTSPGVVSSGVGQFALRGSCHLWLPRGPGPDPGQEEVTQIWGEKGRGDVRGEPRPGKLSPPHVPTWGQGVTAMGSHQPVSYTHLTLPTNREV